MRVAVIQLLHQQPLAADRTEDLEQRRHPTSAVFFYLLLFLFSRPTNDELGLGPALRWPIVGMFAVATTGFAYGGFRGAGFLSLAKRLTHPSRTADCELRMEQVVDILRLMP